jgi:hypothetical protein
MLVLLFGLARVVAISTRKACFKELMMSQLSLLAQARSIARDDQLIAISSTVHHKELQHELTNHTFRAK